MNDQAKELLTARVVNALRSHIDALLIAAADAEVFRDEQKSGVGSARQTQAAAERQAQIERATIAAAEPYFPAVTSAWLDSRRPELRAEYLMFLTSLVVRSPGYRNSLTGELVRDG